MHGISDVKEWIRGGRRRLKSLPMTKKIILVLLLVIYLPVLLVSFFWYQHSLDLSRGNLYNKIDSVSSILINEYAGIVNEMQVLSDIVGNKHV